MRHALVIQKLNGVCVCVRKSVCVCVCGACVCLRVWGGRGEAGECVRANVYVVVCGSVCVLLCVWARVRTRGLTPEWCDVKKHA